MLKRTFSAAVALLLSGGQAFAWGSEGHYIVALIAVRELSPVAKAQVVKLLDASDASDAMERVSTWADEIRPSRPETAPWHYVDIEVDSNGYEAARDCPNDDCVVGQIERDAAILKDKSLAKPVRAEALRFLIHFIGDEHQPLHCSDNHDRGGNQVRVILLGRETNLHAEWDTSVVEALGDDPAVVAAQLSTKITPADQATWSKGTPASWADESWHIAKQDIYADILGRGGISAPIILPPDYASKKAPIAAEQLEKAGVRLAKILNAVLK
jgi:hypothetical protein